MELLHVHLGLAALAFHQCWQHGSISPSLTLMLQLLYMCCPAGSWQRTARGQWYLQAPLIPQLLRVVASVAATAAMLLGAAAVLLAALNLQGLVVPSHRLLYIPQLAALSLPGGPLAEGWLSQVTTMAGSSHCAQQSPWHCKVWPQSWTARRAAGCSRNCTDWDLTSHV